MSKPCSYEPLAKPGLERTKYLHPRADALKTPVVVNLLVVYYLDIVRLENGYRRVALFVFLNTNFGSAID